MSQPQVRSFRRRSARLLADTRGCDGGVRQELAGIGQRFYARLRGRPLGRRRGDGASVLEAPCWKLPYAQALKTSRRTA